MSDWFVYMVSCADGSLYTGITTDPTRRKKEHNAKKGAKSLYGRLPVKIVFLEKSLDQQSAAKREREIKGWRHSRKLVLVGINPSKGIYPEE